MNDTHLQKYADDILLSLLKEDNRDAFDVIYMRYWERLYFYLVKTIKNAEEAEDILQEVFVSLWKRRSDLDGIESLSAYLFSCVRYGGFRYIRNEIKKNEFRKSWNFLFHEEDHLPEMQLAANELSRLLNKEIDNLPVKMREVFILSRKEELSYKEIAHKLNISDKTVKKQISNALKYLHLKLNGKVLLPLFFLIQLF
ncbi:RNA polymerase sigma-70 factor, ECF subfamily [Chitinophaga sp. YR573]|uniref:RNA polymerase sigma-70 factor n=1 Tax=Chitinophaga sp. YR573 TaxID=1881040 RepID=UPI0008D0361E|nr:RNA polymerase sigma-70 factor [Chitinophaga sp. YR573]SEW35984.1 RNA polymerase sigma-70 factor, ECF subfamily [Chitinophaga sp. YR573]